VLGGEGSTEQITDGYGRTYFKYTQNPCMLDDRQQSQLFNTQSVKHVNWDDATRIPNLMEVPTFGSVHTQTQMTIEQTRGLHRPEARSEFYYHRPGLPPSHAISRSIKSTMAFVGVGSQRRGRAVGEALAAAPEDALHFQIRGKSHGKMRWTVVAPRMSVTVLASMELGVVDSIYLGGTGGHFQNVTVQFPNATKARDVSLTVTGWRGDDRQRARSFVLEGLSLENADSIRAQISDGGRELVIENLGPARIFNLKLLTGLKAETVTVRSNLLLDAASVVRLRPSDWSLVAPAAAPIRLEVLDKSWQKVLSSKNV
jgi:hypothetical protein